MGVHQYTFTGIPPRSGLECPVLK